MKQKVYMIMLFLSSIIVVSCNPEKKTSSETVRNLNGSDRSESNFYSSRVL